MRWTNFPGSAWGNKRPGSVSFMERTEGGAVRIRRFRRLIDLIGKVRLEGFEPPTPGSGIQCSIQLSYRRIGRSGFDFSLAMIIGYEITSPISSPLIIISRFAFPSIGLHPYDQGFCLPVQGPVSTTPPLQRWVHRHKTNISARLRVFRPSSAPDAETSAG